MKNFLKWMGIILGSLILIVVLTGLFLYNKYFGFTDYPSGGVLTENQAKYDVISYDLELTVNSSEKSISGWATVRIKSITNRIDKVELDLFNDLMVTEVLSQGVPQKFTRDGDKLWVDLIKPLVNGESADLRVS